LGRADQQVKIRGARIELAEVEAALQEQPEISACVVEVVRPEQSEPAELRFCLKCGLPSNYPGTSFDADGVCELCRFYDRHQDKIQQYFKTPADLREIVAQIQASKRGKYDCMLLLSGGKDSTYALGQIVDMGLSPLVFSFDNGYLSNSAKTNIRRVTERLGVDLIWGETPHIKTIFADSLKRHSNVCNGCFKTIYTLSLNEARRRGLKFIFTGLSRGQLFETRLGHLFNQRLFAVEDMDSAILEARKLYHQLNDAVSQLLDVEIFKNDTIFDEIRFVDFYRYTQVTLEDMVDYLHRRLAWVRPADTGRSTNCLINEAGIYVHRQERGYHNYALPYSWDVRLGHKTRAEAMAELDDELNLANVKRMLAEVGYESPDSAATTTENRLAAYYVSQRPLTVSALRGYLSAKLPDYMLPTYFVELDQLPLTPNGKVDRRALPNPLAGRPTLGADFVPPTGPVEARLAEIWAQTLGLKQIGAHDNFFDLGGASIPAVQVLAQVTQTFQVELPLRSIFEAPTVATLSQRIEAALLAEIESLSDEEAEQLLAKLG
jgi:acyl-CoA synthetase (AMP-forming)/AMP-acid ligase II/acyl carrier protein